jgi:heme exporter protein D
VDAEGLKARRDVMYAGLIEIALSFGGFMLFIIWQMRTLKRDIRAREAREARERVAASES